MPVLSARANANREKYNDLKVVTYTHLRSLNPYLLHCDTKNTQPQSYTYVKWGLSLRVDYNAATTEYTSFRIPREIETLSLGTLL